MTAPSVCRRGPHCIGRDPQGNPAPADRALCHRDEDELDRVLREEPDLLAKLRVDALAPLAGRGLAERTAGGAVEAPLLFRADLDELADQLVATTVQWATIVAGVAGVLPPPPGMHYAGHALTEAVRILRARRSVLLALQPVALERAGDMVALDGGDAALELFHLHHRVRSAIGKTRRVVYLSDPCPTCRVKGLCRFDGQPGIRCAACGADFELDDIQGTLVHQPNVQATVIALGDNQYTRETVTRFSGGRRIVREQWTGHPDGGAGVLAGKTDTTTMDDEQAS